MKSYITILLMGSCTLSSFALPVTQIKKKKEEITLPETIDLETSLGYERYMNEVLALVESYPEFQKKLRNATKGEIRSGKIAEEFAKVDITTRFKLDEIKRRELLRLKKLTEMKNEINLDDPHLKHLDHKKLKFFEINDLKDLIKKINEDNQKEKEQFKEYEMEKKLKDETKKEEMTNDQRVKLEQEQKAMRERHKRHPKIHHPGTKAQLEEVWVEQDHMDARDFEARKLFMIHDLDSNGFLDDSEVKALFVKELDKTNYDMMERAQEMERMREEFFQEFDANRDHFVSIKEFLNGVKRKEFNEDPEWHPLVESPQFTQEEYIEFKRRRLDELHRRREIVPHNIPQGYKHGPNVVYQTGQEHPYYNQQQQMHYQNPQIQHMQQQQNYQPQQQQYGQQQQQYQPQQPQYQPQQQQYQPQQQQYAQQQQQYQPQYEQHQYAQQQLQFPDQQVYFKPNQVYQHIPVQHQQPQPQVVNQLPAQQQHQPRINNLPPQQPVANKNLQQQQPVTSNSGVKQQSVSNNMHS